MKIPQTTSALVDEPPLIADCLALDMLNTGGRDARGEPREFWRDAQAVVRWLTRTNLIDAQLIAQADLDGLVQKAVALREHARTLIMCRKADRQADATLLNDYLRLAPARLQLVWDTPSAPFAFRAPADMSVYQILRPLCEATVDLLVNGDFKLVRQCEHPGCVLWFYDRTKGHHRRWCSMAVCGNRHKAARYKARQSF
ncbi:CGNR zinc finger domain-containing protein [Martelella alba]|uniref:Zinc finger CGNR domain-containing protein n=1 Tax=Martelella alba TaxID=2590451 RepID=A0ABY2SPQ6_9HYPH|nr:CGNR zinc finger domain-containing protein [Martelella alba]TKI07667.1 hypothetical protein FCN80_04265 [Martelella alba]